MRQLRVHALTVDRGGCFHYRIRQPLTALRELRGAVTSWGSGMDVETYLHANVLLVQYLHSPTSVEDVIRWAEDGSKLIVWDIDDDITDITEHVAKNTAYMDPETAPRMMRAIQAAHLVTVSTPRLAEIVSAVNTNVQILRNCVPDWLPDHTMPNPGPGTSIVYPCSPSHQQDLEAFGPTLLRYMTRYPSTRLHFMGPTHRPLGIPATWQVTCRGWIRHTEDYLRALSGHIGIAPLADLNFNRAKSGIKAQEYQALGIVPVVADWPQYRDVVMHGETGFLVRTPAQWVDALAALTTDQDLRSTMAAAGRRHAETFTQSAGIDGWDTAYRKGLDVL